MSKSASQKTHKSPGVQTESQRNPSPLFHFSFKSPDSQLFVSYLYSFQHSGVPFHDLYSHYGFLPVSKKPPKSSCYYLRWKLTPSQIKENSSQIFSIIVLLNIEKVCIYILYMHTLMHTPVLAINL